MSGDLLARVRAAGTSFYWAIRLLPPERREAMAAVYLFCRVVDDIADDPAPAAEKASALAAWRAWAADDAPCPEPSLNGPLADARNRFDLPRRPFVDIVDGVSMDLPPGLMGPPLADLQRYCAGVAGAVGLLSVRVFGTAGGGAIDAFALATGEAMQFTNILRDLAPDAAIGRLYLPREDLEAAGVPVTEEPAGVLAHPRIGHACAALADRAEARYAEALALLRGLPARDRRALRPAVVMLALYHGLLDRLCRRGWGDAATLETPPPANRLATLGTVLRYRLFDA